MDGSTNQRIQEKKATTNGGKSAPSPAPARGADKAAERKVQRQEEKMLEQRGSAESGGAGGGPGGNLDSFAASNIDDALDLLAVTASSSSTSAALKQKEVDRHPERRAKAAYTEYEQQMLPQLRQENPTLRLSQLKELLWKRWQKAPENVGSRGGGSRWPSHRSSLIVPLSLSLCVCVCVCLGAWVCTTIHVHDKYQRRCSCRVPLLVLVLVLLLLRRQPFNQAFVAHNASREEQVDLVNQLVKETEDRLRIHK